MEYADRRKDGIHRLRLNFHRERINIKIESLYVMETPMEWEMYKWDVRFIAISVAIWVPTLWHWVETVAT
jgi:hypothetical protein